MGSGGGPTGGVRRTSRTVDLIPTRVVEGIHVDPDLAEREDIKASLGTAGRCAVTGSVVMFFTGGSWWIMIAVFVLAVGVAHLVDAAWKSWRRWGRTTAVSEHSPEPPPL